MGTIKRKKSTLLIAGVVGLLLWSCGSGQNKQVANTGMDSVTNRFISFDFTLNKKSVHDRVVFLDSLGYQGVTFNVNNIRDIDKLIEYQKEVNLVTTNQFTIPAVYHVLNPDRTAGERITIWKKLLNQLALSQTDLWLIVSKGNNASFTHEELAESLKSMCDFADSLHVNVIIYPHDNTFIESASEALIYLKEVNKKNLFLSFHLCHELRAGNGLRLNEAIAEVAPYIKMASISGADSIMMENPPKGYWDDAIKPLYKGAYNTKAFLESLVRNGYKGPIALHTFGLKEPVNEHFEKSMKEWTRMSKEVTESLSK